MSKLGYKTSNAFSMEGKVERRGRPKGVKGVKGTYNRFAEGVMTPEDREAIRLHGLMLKQQVKDGSRCDECYSPIPTSMIGTLANGKTCFECLIREEIFRGINSEKLNDKYRGLFEEEVLKLAAFIMEGGVERLEEVRQLTKEELITVVSNL